MKADLDFLARAYYANLLRIRASRQREIASERSASATRQELEALAYAAGIDADAAECAEIDRILSKPPEWFTARNAAKNAAGFDVTVAYPPALPKR